MAGRQPALAEVTPEGLGKAAGRRTGGGTSLSHLPILGASLSHLEMSPRVWGCELARAQS